MQHHQKYCGNIYNWEARGLIIDKFNKQDINKKGCFKKYIRTKGIKVNESGLTEKNNNTIKCYAKRLECHV